MTIYSYRWKLNGLDVIEPEEDFGPRQQFVECPRGTASGKACFYVRREDLASILDASTVSITAELFTREATDGNWLSMGTTTFPGWIPVESDEADGRKFVYVTLRDERQKLEKTAIEKIWNAVFLVAYEPGGSSTQYTFYNRAYCNTANTPYTFSEIITDIFTQAGITVPTIPVSPTPMDNIQGTGNCADTLAGLLASAGCDLLRNPFTGAITIVELSDSQTLSQLARATAEGKLIGYKTLSLTDSQKHGKCIVWPADYFPISDVLSDTGTFGTGTKAIDIIDYALADPTTRQVKAARLTEIEGACTEWFRAEGELLHKTFFGIVKQLAGTRLRSVTYYLPFGEETNRTVCINDCIPMPWVKRVEHFYQGSIKGKTLGSGLGSTVPERVAYWRNIPGGAFEDTGKEVDAITIGTELGAYIDLAMWPNDDRWLAVGVCEY